MKPAPPEELPTPGRLLLGLAGEHLSPDPCRHLMALRRRERREECSWYSSLTLGWEFQPSGQAATHSMQKLSFSAVINAWRLFLYKSRTVLGHGAWILTSPGDPGFSGLQQGGCWQDQWFHGKGFRNEQIVSLAPALVPQEKSARMGCLSRRKDQQEPVCHMSPQPSWTP